MGSPFAGAIERALALPSFYDACLLAAMLFGWIYLYRALRRLTSDPVKALVVLPLAVTVPVFFARTVDLAIYTPGYMVSHPQSILEPLRGGLSSHGAVVGLVVVAVLIARVIGRRFSEVATPVSVWGFLGIVAARIGDFYHGHGHGIPTILPWGLPERSIVAGNALPRHPVNLYEILLVGVLSAALLVSARRNADTARRPFWPLAWALYLLSRLVIDALREVPLAWDCPGITVSQLLSLPMALAFLAVYLRRSSVFCSGESPGLTSPAIRVLATRHNRAPKIVLGAATAAVALGTGLGATVLPGIAGTKSATVAVDNPSTMALSVLFWAIASVLSFALGRLVFKRLASMSRSGGKWRVAAVGCCWMAAVAVGFALVLTSPMSLGALLVAGYSFLLPVGHSPRHLFVFLFATACTGLAAAAIGVFGSIDRPSAVVGICGLGAVLMQVLADLSIRDRQSH